MGSKGKPNMSLVTIEAYAVPSSTYVQNDSHCFVVTEDKNDCWKNGGRGWKDVTVKTKVVQTRAYKEWLFEFVPPGNINKCGITFGENGVCHTYANRELLLGEDNVDVREAPKDYVAVVFFGKYGFGLNQLKQLLTESYQKVTGSYDDPYGALNKVLNRVDNTIDDELRAWRQTGIEYAKIPVDEILAKNPQGGLAVARSRLRDLISKREKIYQDYVDRKISDSQLRSNVKALIQAECDDYLNMLARIHYITEEECRTYSDNIRNFLSRVGAVLRAQQAEFQRTGRIAQDFRQLQDLNLEDME